LRNKVKKKITNKKTGKKKIVKYSIPVDFNPKLTLAMEENLKEYNALAQDNVVTVKLRGEDLITPSVLIDGILQGFVSGAITLLDSELLFKEPVPHQCSGIDAHSSVHSDSVDSPVLSVFSHLPGLMITSISYDKYSYATTTYNDDDIELIYIDNLLSSITNTLSSQQWQYFQPKTTFFLYLFYMKKLFSLLKFNGRTKKVRSKKRKNLFNEERPLADFGIKSLEFEINKKYLHRVFNRGSQSFDKGGRFYGPFYQSMSGDLRSRILINGNETIEIDYSAMHPRMLYHLLDIDYKDDPYLIGDDSLRAEYKIVTLISINAKKQGSHIAVKDALEDAGFDIADDLKDVQALMQNYQRNHKPIQEFLFSGVGVDLQNVDSLIMERILMRLHKHGICGLCVHDSVIVEKEHCDYLHKIMMEEYKKVMGYAPVIKKPFKKKGINIKCKKKGNRHGYRKTI